MTITPNKGNSVVSLRFNFVRIYIWVNCFFFDEDFSSEFVNA